MGQGGGVWGVGQKKAVNNTQTGECPGEKKYKLKTNKTLNVIQ